MNKAPIGAANRDMARAFFSSPRFVAALTTTAVASAVLSFAIRQTLGWPGLIAILTTLVVLATLSLMARKQMIEWYGLLPISLLAFVGWAGLSLLWSQYQWSTLAALAYLFAFTVLGVFMALVRDTIQIVRVFGNVLRVVLGASLALEILAGVLIDSPIRFLGIAGRLDELGPIQGVLGTRNQLGLVAVIALVTFFTELRTKSVRRGVAISSLVLAGFVILLSRSPVSAGALVVVGLAALALFGLRRLSNDARRIAQFALLALVVVAAVAAWATRSVIVQVFNATGELTFRLELWREVLVLIPLHSLEGWGWIGLWRHEIPPFQAFAAAGQRPAGSALNAFVDTWFQLGLVGLVIFIGLIGLTFARSWLLGSQQRSTVFTWPALVLVVLIVSSLAESSILVEFGWLTLVICSVKAAQHLSWRKAFAATGPASASS